MYLESKLLTFVHFLAIFCESSKMDFSKYFTVSIPFMMSYGFSTNIKKHNIMLSSVMIYPDKYLDMQRFLSLNNIWYLSWRTTLYHNVLPEIYSVINQIYGTYWISFINQSQRRRWVLFTAMKRNTSEHPIKVSIFHMNKTIKWPVFSFEVICQ